MKKARRVEVRPIAPSTLLVLDDTRFRRQLDRSVALQEAVRASAEKPGFRLSAPPSSPQVLP